MLLLDLLYVLTPIAAIIVFAMIVILLIMRLNKQRYQIARDAGDFLGIDRQREIDATLNRVNDIAAVNHHFRGVLNQLNDIHTEFTKQNEKAKTLVAKIKEESTRKKIVNKEFKKLNVQLKEQKEVLVSLEKRFKSISNQVVQQDNMIRSEFSYYQSCLRRTTELYKEKRILLDGIAKQIDALTIRIREIEREFDAVVISADSEKANILLRKYVVNVVKFTRVINEGPQIWMHLKTMIGTTVDKLNKLYVEKRDSLQIPLDHINFNKSVRQISKKYTDAKVAFEELDMEKAKELVVTILKAFKTLENRINLEIKSRNIFFKDYEATINAVKKVLTDWVSIKRQFKELAGSGKELSEEVFEQYHALKEAGKSLDALALSFRELMKDKVTAFSAKAQRMKMVLDQTHSMTEMMNVFIEMLWNINLTESLTRNKFKRSEAAINELVANIKRENIKLSPKEKEEFDKLVDEKSKIANRIGGNINKEIIEYVDKFSTKVVNLYSIINGNAQIAMHIKNMLAELAPQRSSNPRLNVNLNLVEREFMDGKYDAALNLIIESISERK